VPRKPPPKKRKLTALESVVMDALWDVPCATVRQVHERLNPVRPMAYNTVLTVMRILRDKGYLESERDGRSDVYRPCVSREQVARRSLKELVDVFFAGSRERLVSHLISDRDVSDEELRAIRREVDRRLRP
jgi:predicted transcriptional regulator